SLRTRLSFCPGHLSFCPGHLGPCQRRPQLHLRHLIKWYHHQHSRTSKSRPASALYKPSQSINPGRPHRLRSIGI
uniref:Uncharacterized protein n=1 Tax=Bursaphelenchus xylophilus TaxID=6326 RepID=A0A1I7SN04_BURXY